MTIRAKPRAGRTRTLLAAVIVTAAGCERSGGSDVGNDRPGGPPSLDVSSESRVTIVDLGTLGGCCSVARGINDSGQVVGWSTTSDGATHAFLWEDGAMTDLGELGPAFSQGRDINNAGQLVGVSRTADGTRGFLWENGEMNDLGALPGGTSSTASAINDSGQIVGTSDDRLSNGATLWEAGTITSLHPPDAISSGAADVNDVGQVVGFLDAGGRHAFLWEDGVLTTLSDPGGAGDSQAFGINDAGQVVGRSRTPASTSIAILWQGGASTELKIEGAIGSEAVAINNTGHIAVRSTTAGSDSRAFLWKAGTVIDLGTLGGDVSRATDINDAGRIVGSSSDADGFERATMWIVPTPAPERRTEEGEDSSADGGREVVEPRCGPLASADARRISSHNESRRTNPFRAPRGDRRMAGIPDPTDAELEILTVLWDRGPSTVRDVYESLEGTAEDPNARRYTTVLKLMQNMAEKGLVARDERRRAHVYEAVISRDSTRSRLVEELAEKAFGGSTLRLALQALSSREATRDEIEQVREIFRDAGVEPE